MSFNKVDSNFSPLTSRSQVYHQHQIIKENLLPYFLVPVCPPMGKKLFCLRKKFSGFPVSLAKSVLLIVKMKYAMSLVPTKANLELCGKVMASSFCIRRLVNNEMLESVKMATQYVQPGHVRVGPEIVMDLAFLVTRNVKDFVTWVDASAIKKKVLEYNGMRDDFDFVT